MPQFDSIFFESQIFWTIISFLILFIVLKKWILPPITHTLKERAQQIEHNLAKANQARLQAEQLKKTYANQLHHIQQEAKKILDQANEDARKVQEQSILATEQEIQRQKQNLLRDEDELRRKSIDEIRKQSATLVLAAAEQLIQHQFDKNDAQRELDHAISALESDLKSGSIKPKL